MAGAHRGHASHDARRSVARELHDGLAQELAFIVSRARRLDHSGADAATATQIEAAAERALFELRCAIELLRVPDDAPLDVLVERVATTFLVRFGVIVELQLARGLEVDAERRAAVLRILGEAMANAIAHGRASRVTVRLARSEHGLTLRVEDDGRGFDVGRTPHGWGLAGMRERAELFGGLLLVASHPGRGAVIEAVLP